jgi:transcriptional regulator with XRE-family HTH domain
VPPSRVSDNLSRQVSTEIRAWMARRGLTQQDVALALGISRQAVSARLNGQTQWTLDDLAAVAEALGVSVTTLLSSPS